MRWQYNHLNTTPYLHPSKELRQMYNESKSRSRNRIDYESYEKS